MKSPSFLITALIVQLAIGGLHLAPSAAGDQSSPPLATVAWDKIKDEGRLKMGEVVPGEHGGSSRLKIVNLEPGMKSLPLCELDSPPITTPSYAIRGKIRYENVVGVGFLEMWNHFEGDHQFFSRTLGTEGLMQMVTGSSPEREFELPFHTGGQGSPRKLTLNLVLNGPGTVEIGPLELVSISPVAFTMDSASGWWTNQTSGLIGGIGGSVIGVLGAVIGTLVSLGRGKKFVLSLAVSMTACGAAVFVAGIVAAVNRQPFNVYYLMLFMGGMMAFFGCLILCIAPIRFRDCELRRMQALDT